MLMESFTYEILSELYRKETNNPGLQKVQMNLYPTMNQLYDEVNTKYHEAKEIDSTSKETDRYFTMRKNTKSMIDSVRTVRFSKVCRLAFRAAEGGEADLNVMTQEEKDLYNETKELILKHIMKVTS